MTTLQIAAQQALEQAEPVQEPGTWVASKDGYTIQDNDFTHDVVLRVSGDFANDEQRIRYAQRIVDALNAALSKAEPGQEPVAWYQKRGQEVLTSHPACWGREDEPWTPLYTAPPRRTMVPLTEEEIERIHRHLCHTVGSSYKTVARAIEKASWEKNNGQA